MRGSTMKIFVPSAKEASIRLFRAKTAEEKAAVRLEVDKILSAQAQIKKAVFEAAMSYGCAFQNEPRSGRIVHAFTHSTRGNFVQITSIYAVDGKLIPQGHIDAHTPEDIELYGGSYVKIER